MRTQIITTAAFTLAVLAAGTLAAQTKKSVFTINRTRAPQSAVLVPKMKAPQGQVVQRLADLAIVRVTPDEDGKPPQKVTIVNQGGTTAGKFRIRVRSINGYGNLVMQRDFFSQQLAPGAARTYQLNTAHVGLSWSIVVDAKKQVREGNERNNYWANSRLR